MKIKLLSNNMSKVGKSLKQFSPPLIHGGENFEKYKIEVSKAYLDTTVIIN